MLIRKTFKNAAHFFRARVFAFRIETNLIANRYRELCRALTWCQAIAKPKAQAKNGIHNIMHGDSLIEKQCIISKP